MKIIIGKFGEDGEPIWFEVESDDCKKGREGERRMERLSFDGGHWTRGILYG